MGYTSNPFHQTHVRCMIEKLHSIKKIGTNVILFLHFQPFSPNTCSLYDRKASLNKKKKLIVTNVILFLHFQPISPNTCSLYDRKASLNKKKKLIVTNVILF